MDLAAEVTALVDRRRSMKRIARQKRLCLTVADVVAGARTRNNNRHHGMFRLMRELNDNR